MAKEQKKLTLDDFNADDNDFLDNIQDDDSDIGDTDTDEDQDDTDSPEDQDVDDEPEKNDKKKDKGKDKQKPPKSKKEAAKDDKDSDANDDEDKDSDPDIVDGADDSTDDEGDEDTDQDSNEDVSPDKFFEEVEKITGIDLDIDYGDVDPLTPQGVALREKALVEYATDSFLEELQQRHPKVYQAMQYAYAGKDVAELFQNIAQRDYSKVELKDSDTELARQILREYYQQKGVKNETKIKNLILTEEESEEGLVKSAQAAAKELAEAQANEQNIKLEQAQKEQAEQKRKDRVLVASIDELLESGKLDTFKLSGKAEVNEFRNFLLSNVQRLPNGGYAFTIPIDSRNLEKTLQSEYFRFKKGDLSKLIQIKAATENANKLRLRASKDKRDKRSSGDNDEPRNEKLSLRDF